MAQIRMQTVVKLDVKTKVIVPKQAYSENFLTEMESLDNILQSNTIFVEIPQ